MTWEATAPGVLVLPSGRCIRGRSLRSGTPGGPDPEFGVYLLGRAPRPAPWPSRWVRWRDFGQPSDPADAATALVEAWQRAVTERVEFGCRGGRGRTGTALACLAVLDGMPADEAVELVRGTYDRHAIETAGQRRFVARFEAAGPLR